MADVKEQPKEPHYPPQYFDPEYCRRMAEYHELIAETYHEDGFREEFLRHKQWVSWWRTRRDKLLKKEIHP